MDYIPLITHPGLLGNKFNSSWANGPERRARSMRSFSTPWKIERWFTYGSLFRKLVQTNLFQENLCTTLFAYHILLGANIKDFLVCSKDTQIKTVSNHTQILVGLSKKTNTRKIVLILLNILDLKSF